MKDKNPFPTDFLWGAATSAHQVEGNQRNNWTEWESTGTNKCIEVAKERYSNLPSWPRIKGQVLDPDNYVSGMAADHYNRFPEDIGIMKSLELNSYRFSIEWSRIEPERGKFNNEAIEHYRKVLQAIRAAGMTPFVTLHHFTDPIWLEEAGGWHGRDFPVLFARYVDKVVSELGGMANLWLTFNEPESYMISRYFDSPIWLWPGWPHQEFNPWCYFRARRQFIKAHKLAYMTIKHHNPQVRVSYGHGIVWFECKNWWSKILATLLDYNGGTGKFRRTRGYQDFLAVHYYIRVLIDIGFSRPFNWVKIPQGDKTSDNGWEIYPGGLYNLTQKLKKYELPIYITENGIADAEDKLRAEFITEHVEEMKRSINDGANIRGYFHWSLLDNYEWSNGYWPQFGLVQVDRETQRRTLRPSAKTYSKIIKDTLK